MFIDDILKGIGHREHPNCECSDSEVITTAVAAALHFGGNHSDAIDFVQEAGLMPNMVEASRFSRRIHRVGELVADLFLQLGHVFKSLSKSMVYCIDSFPLSSCHNIRIPRSRLFGEEQYRERNASKRQYFYGIKVFVMTDEANRPVEYCPTPGSWADIDGLRQTPLDLPPGSEAYLDSGRSAVRFTDYDMEDELKQAEDLNFFVARKSNSKRPHHPSVNFLINHYRKPIETTFSEITALFLRKIHAVTDRGFILKVILTLFAYTLTKVFI